MRCEQEVNDKASSSGGTMRYELSVHVEPPFCSEVVQAW